MSLRPENYLNGHYHRLTPELVSYIMDVGYELRLLASRDITLAFVDGEDPRYNDGFHEWGMVKSLVLVRVWDREAMPDIALEWIIAHELCHVRQALDNSPLLESEELYEKEAEDWATEYTGYDGVEWYNKFRTLQCKGIKWD